MRISPLCLAALALAAASPPAQAQSSITTAQVTVGTSATLLADVNPRRVRIYISVLSAANCAFGNSGVTLTTGLPLQPVAGATITIDSRAALYAVCSAPTTIAYLESYQAL